MLETKFCHLISGVHRGLFLITDVERGLGERSVSFDSSFYLYSGGGSVISCVTACEHREGIWTFDVHIL